ncbi:hypothetical protein CN112_24970 [Sinorhizobium meliloti]|nr:hypothetical protein CN112_24970 [Sinorhizobium meliloti]
MDATAPANCPACGKLIGAGSRHTYEKRKYGAEAMMEWEDVTTVTSVRCLCCFKLLHKQERVRREFFSE